MDTQEDKKVDRQKDRSTDKWMCRQTYGQRNNSRTRGIGAKKLLLHRQTEDRQTDGRTFALLILPRSLEPSSTPRIFLS